MFKKKRKRVNQSIIKRFVRIMIPAIVLLLTIFSFLLYGTYRTRDLTYKYIVDTTKLYTSNLQYDLNRINLEIISYLQTSEELDQIEEVMRPDRSKYYEAYKKIKEDILNLRIKNKYIYSFFIYRQEADFLIYDDSIYFTTSIKNNKVEELKKSLRYCLSDDYSGNEWDFFQAENQNYVFSFFEKNNIVIGCVIDSKDLFEDFNMENLGYDGIPFLMDGDKIISASEKSDENSISEMLIKAEKKSVIFNGYSLYNFTLGNMGKLYVLITPSGGVLEGIIVMQIISIILFIFIVVFAFVGIIYSYNRIFEPMKSFLEDIENPNEELWLNRQVNILELEAASAKFKTLIKRVKSLKILLYEKEIAQNKIELEYAQEQIKPHFFLSCLSIIHGLAEKFNVTEIVDIVEILSDYMRYTLKGSFEFKKLKDEIKHVNNFVRIQEFRYSSAFSFEAIMDSNLEEYLIPPLVLQVFVENALFHAVSFEKFVEITLYIELEKYENKNYIYICLSDTGKGFPQQVLEMIEKNEEVNFNGEIHYGIRNTINRLKYIYGDKATIKFSNLSDEGGAIVEIKIPANLPKKI